MVDDDRACIRAIRDLLGFPIDVESLLPTENLSEGFDERGQPLLCLSYFAIRLSQQGKKM